ncbi:hypothetical protein HOK021_24160 [Streptomyces hygroscopicus]|nr:hypothetical protein HOK021_24160 [Streptomyces hygroscopicus]
MDGSCACNMVPIAPSATTTREARASRNDSTRVVLMGDGVFEAMEMLPWLRRLSALHPPGEGAPGQRSCRFGTRVPRSTPWTAPFHPAACTNRDR